MKNLSDTGRKCKNHHYKLQNYTNNTKIVLLPAFLVVTYIIFFFFLPPIPVQRFPLTVKENSIHAGREVKSDLRLLIRMIHASQSQTQLLASS